MSQFRIGDTVRCIDTEDTPFYLEGKYTVGDTVENWVHIEGDGYWQDSRFELLRPVDLETRIQQTEQNLERLKGMRKEQFHPEPGATYWYVSTWGKVAKTCNDKLEFDTETIAFGNCFRTKQEALAAAERVRKVYMTGCLNQDVG